MEEVKIASIFRERGHYYAALSYEEEAGLKAKTCLLYTSDAADDAPRV